LIRGRFSHNLAHALEPGFGMMNRMGRYMFRQLVVGMIMVAAGLTCVIWLMAVAAVRRDDRQTAA